MVKIRINLRVEEDKLMDFDSKARSDGLDRSKAIRKLMDLYVDGGITI